MNKRECINLHGKMTYEMEAFERLGINEMSPDDKQRLVIKYSPRLNREYCSFHCPISQRCKYVNRYNSQKKPIAKDLNRLTHID